MGSTGHLLLLDLITTHSLWCVVGIEIWFMWVLTFVVMQAFNMHFFVLSKPAVTLTQSSGGSEDGCKYLHLWRNVPYVTQTSVVMSQLSNACSVFALEGYLLVTCCFASVHACVIGQTQRTQTWKNHCFYVTSPQNFG